MTYENLRKIQEQQLRIMDEIHKLCVKKNYRYYMIGGSALGAVRHKGFIPWDVDIDIAMPRKDYDAFSTDGYKDLPDFLEFHDYRKDKKYGTCHALVTLKNSSLLFVHDIENSRNNRFGIFVDILPLDQWPANDKKKKLQMRQIFLINTLKEFYQGAIRKEDNILKRIAKNVIQLGLHCVMSYYFLNMLQQKIVSQFKTEDEGCEWCSMLSHYSLNKLTMDKRIFGKPRLMDFSGRQFFVPEYAERYLAKLFGNYMKTPSEDAIKKQIDSVYSASWISLDNSKVEIN